MGRMNAVNKPNGQIKISILIFETLLLLVTMVANQPKNERMDLMGKSIRLSPGSYTIYVDYECAEQEGFYKILPESLYNAFLQGDKQVRLPLSKNHSEQQISPLVAVEDFSIQFSDAENMTVKSAYLIPNHRNFIKRMILMVLLVCTINFFLFSEKKQDKIRTVLFLAFLLLSLPLFVNYLLFFQGHDMIFHLMRIEGIKDGLLCGQFPVRNYPNFYDGYGHAVPIFYPDLFLYFPATLRMLGFSVMEAYKAFILCLNALTIVISYKCFKIMFRDAWIGMMGCVLYSLSAYRLIDLYLRAAIGEAIAMTFLPAAMLGIYLLVIGGADDSKKKAWMLTAFSFSAILEAHILSFYMTIIFTGIFCLLFLKKIIVEGRWKGLLKAAALAIVLCSGFIVPFLDLSSGLNVSRMSIGSLQAHGSYVAQVLMAFPEVSGQSYWVGWGIPGNMPVNIGLPLTLGGVLFFVFFKDKEGEEASKVRKIGYVAVGFGAAALFMTTYVFPWDHIRKISDVVEKVVAVIQFPWRFLAPATVFLTVASCATMYFAVGKDENRRKVYLVAMGTVCIICSTYFMGSLLKNAVTYRVYDGLAIDAYSSYGGDEYLPEGTDRDLIPLTKTTLDQGEYLEVRNYEKSGTEIIFEVRNASSDDGAIQLPLIYFKGYAAFGESRERLPISMDEHGYVVVEIPAYYQGRVLVKYSGTWYWRIFDIASVLAFGIIMIYYRYEQKGFCRPSRKVKEKVNDQQVD